MSSERWITVQAPARGRARASSYQSIMTGGSGFDEGDYEPPRNARIRVTNVPEALRDDELQALVQMALDDGGGFPLPLHYPTARNYCIRRRLVSREDVLAEEAGA